MGGRHSHDLTITINDVDIDVEVEFDIDSLGCAASFDDPGEGVTVVIQDVYRKDNDCSITDWLNVVEVVSPFYVDRKSKITGLWMVEQYIMDHVNENIEDYDGRHDQEGYEPEIYHWDTRTEHDV